MLHLINMPFASTLEPSLALGVMKSQLAEAGIAGRVFDLNFDFGRRIGFGAYETIAHFRGVRTQVGEWLFAGEAWKEPFGPPEEEFLRMCSNELGEIPNLKAPEKWLLQGPELYMCSRELKACHRTC